MKAKDKNALRTMDAKKLQAHADGIREELARLQLDMRMGNLKDSNAIPNKKKELAVVQTFLREKMNENKDTNSEETK